MYPGGGNPERQIARRNERLLHKIIVKVVNSSDLKSEQRTEQLQK